MGGFTLKYKHSLKRDIKSHSISEFSNCRYFTVYQPNEEGLHLAMEQLKANMVDKIEERHTNHARRINLIQASTSLVTKTPWLRHTNWEETFMGYDMVELNSFGKRPRLQEANEHWIWVAIGTMLSQCWDGFHDIRMRGWNMIPYWLASVDRSAEDSKPFKKDLPLYTLERYFGYWQAYLMFCLRVYQLDMEFELIQFTTQQQECLDVVLEYWNIGVAEDINAVYDALLKLSMALSCHSDYCKAKSSLIQFTGVLGYSVEYQQWKKP